MVHPNKGSQSTDHISAGERLSTLMYDRGVTQEMLAREVKVSQSTISRIIKGEIKKPKRDILERVAAALEVDIDDILGSNSLPLAQAGDDALSNQLAWLYRSFYRLGQLSEVESVLTTTSHNQTERSITISCTLVLAREQPE